ncbi:hypothetical protein [Methanobrevibacter curvatus]|uniref:Uncharacterized protein n=1 Tax=Methanobrevibacter curvatus TaxID=49547 RepID=A0A166EE00_9EURY|nr:hypothetical protein [Methanobrevibacter curvatus]KZX16548.1 hypothetical protein MBCUR_00400 [Methanobrevibacter curvatus]
MAIPGFIDFNTNGNTNSTTDNEFPNPVSIGGVQFYIPDGYELVGSSNTNGAYMKSYANDDGDSFSITVYKSLSKSQVISNLKSGAAGLDISNQDSSASYGSYSGFYGETVTDDGDEKFFVSSKGGKAFLIESNAGFNFGENVPKILG